MTNLLMITKLIYFAFGVIGVIISLEELLKFIQTKREASKSTEEKTALPPFYERKARAHRNNFFCVLSIAICLISISLLGSN